jgi:hypothetical protein
MKLFAALVVPLVSARVIRLEQAPLVQEHVEGVAPGIGIHFTSSYATAAAKYQNGTTQDLVRVCFEHYFHVAVTNNPIDRS